MLLNNKLKALMPYTSDFILLPSDYYANEKVGRLSKKSVRALKYLKRKVPYFISDKNLTNGYVNKTWKYVYFELKYFECIHYYFLFLILCSLPTSTGGRGVKLMTMNVYLFAVDSAAPNILHICRVRVTSLRSLLAVLAVIAEHDSDQIWRVIIESPIQFSNHSIKTILKTEMGP